MAEKRRRPGRPPMSINGKTYTETTSYHIVVPTDMIPRIEDILKNAPSDDNGRRQTSSSWIRSVIYAEIEREEQRNSEAQNSKAAKAAAESLKRDDFSEAGFELDPDASVDAADSGLLDILSTLDDFRDGLA